MDNFVKNFKLTKNDMKGARKEAETIANEMCNPEVMERYRCDYVSWIKGTSDQYNFPSFMKIY